LALARRRCPRNEIAYRDTKGGSYGCTGAHRQALQIAINRALYMDELSYRRKPRFARLVGDMSDLVERLAQVAIDCLLKST
jgi:N-formylglutamate amidohydrolase